MAWLDEQCPSCGAAPHCKLPVSSLTRRPACLPTRRPRPAAAWNCCASGEYPPRSLKWGSAQHAGLRLAPVESCRCHLATCHLAPPLRYPLPSWPSRCRESPDGSTVRDYSWASSWPTGAPANGGCWQMLAGAVCWRGRRRGEDGKACIEALEVRQRSAQLMRSSVFMAADGASADPLNPLAPLQSPRATRQSRPTGTANWCSPPTCRGKIPLGVSRGAPRNACCRRL